MDEFKFEKVLESIQIGSMELKNRFVMPPMVTNYATADGAVTDRLKWYHQARARGGVGLIISESVYVDQSGKGFLHQLGMHKEALIPGLRELTDSVHQYGAKMAAQLFHAGRQTSSSLTGLPIVAPSPIPCPVVQEMPKELSVGEIREVISQFRQAARRAKEAGFDCIELHGAHGDLLNQFLSPYSNKRTDEYGGNFEKRMRFPLEVYQSVREEVGVDYPIIYRMSSEEYVPGGMAIEDTKIFAKRLVEAGINALHISGGVNESAYMAIPPASIPEGVHADHASAIKKAIDAAVPVIVAGRIKHPEMAEQIIQDGKADLVAMGRALLADPGIPRKVVEGRTSEIRTCITCSYGCMNRLFQDIGISCTINPITGHEEEYTFAGPVEKKKVLIIGGGPGGLEAARIAALRGHDTVLYEREAQLGGQLMIAAVPPFKGDINDIQNYLINQVESTATTIVNGVEADLTTVRANKPDVVILATGSEELVPKIPGVFQKNVVTSHEVLKGKAVAGENVVIIGGGMTGCETAEFLADQGKHVTVVEMGDDIALEVEPLTRGLLLNRMAAKKIKVLTKTEVREIVSNQVKMESPEGDKVINGADTIVIAAGTRPVNTIAESIRRAGIPVYVIGDAVQPRKILDAVHEGFRVAYNIGTVPIGNKVVVWN